ncbi:MAG: peptidoglycan bridge formation glycyltransferase FemA/FemB family protein, partial [Candidatus Dormibacteraeota bacterium]|nr:peptidoglycan bridge formation glycyltransferase FemA/FemB family protein [Candidatus Dormibacteraeota bacterium]
QRHESPRSGARHGTRPRMITGRDSTIETRWDAELDERSSPAPLLQSWAWGEVQARAGWRIERVRLTDGAMASVQVRSIGLTREAYVPRGPVPASAEAVDALVGWARSARMARLVIEPEGPAALAGSLAERNFAPAPAIQPKHTRIVRLGPPDELLKTFRHGRRYNIRAGLRRGVVVREGKDAAELARQSAAVERRESIHLPDQSYYEVLLELLPWCRTYVAYHPATSEPLATVLVARHAGRAYSLFAARSGVHPELVGNDLAWWTAISSAAEAGCHDFDLWGVPPPNAAPTHPWHGLGSFKAEFGGEAVEYPGAWEKILSSTGAKLIALEKRSRAFARRLKRNIS